jgi:CubicO group peptidase (beta-lactamase class C family)
MRAAIIAFASLATVVIAPAHAGAPTPTTSNVGPQVDQCVHSAMSAHAMIGLAAAVVVDGELAYEAGYGVKHRDLGGAVDAHTAFHHGSTGKMMTAAAVMRLVEQGLVELDDPVTAYVPELTFSGQWPADLITVRHLISNSALVPNFRQGYEYSLTEWAATLGEVSLFAAPGSFWNYSNSNFALAGLVVERASGMSFAEYLTDEIFAVAAMGDSSAFPSDVIASGNYTYGHADDGVIYAPDDRVYPNELASGNAFSSAHDLASWARLMLSDGGDVLSSAASARVQEPQVPRIYTPGGPYSIGGGHYGYGLFIDEYPDATITWHDGGVPGWVGSLSWVRSEGFAVALLANTWPSGFAALDDIERCVFESVLGITQPDMRQPSDPATWKRYRGTYDTIFEDGYLFEVVVELEDGVPFITVPNLDDPTELVTCELENVDRSSFVFYPPFGGWWIVTFIDGPGVPGHVRWIRNQRFVGTRRAGAPRRPSGRLAP